MIPEKYDFFGKKEFYNGESKDINRNYKLVSAFFLTLNMKCSGIGDGSKVW